MKMRTWIASLFLAGAAAATPAWAQMPGMGPGMGPPGFGPPSYGPMMGPGMANPYAPPMYGVAPQGHPQAQQTMYADPAGMPQGVPQGYGYNGLYSADGPAGGYEGGYGAEGCGEGCDDGCGPGGCGFGCHPRLAKLLRCLLPFDDGGCCAPHWFDVHLEYMNLQREDVSRRVDFFSETALGEIVLSSDNLEFDAANGVRATLTKQVGPGSNLELTYFGQHNWASSAAAVSPGNQLFSAFSDFGLLPSPGQGFTETDQASFASIAYSSSIDNLELNFRQRWQGYGCKVQGSYLGGLRFFQLDEDFQLLSVSTLNSAAADYRVSTYNGLFGGQGGGDIWICVIPGLSIGAEAKMGIYMNNSQQDTLLTATTLLSPLEERVEDDNDFTLLTELSFMANWRLSQSWTIRGGYNIIHIDGVALAVENFNSTPPFLQPPFVNPPREARLVNDGDLLLHGFTLGVEYMW